MSCTFTESPEIVFGGSCALSNFKRSLFVLKYKTPFGFKMFKQSFTNCGHCLFMSKTFVVFLLLAHILLNRVKVTHFLSKYVVVHITHIASEEPVDKKKREIAK